MIFAVFAPLAHVFNTLTAPAVLASAARAAPLAFFTVLAPVIRRAETAASIAAVALAVLGAVVAPAAHRVDVLVTLVARGALAAVLAVVTVGAWLVSVTRVSLA